MKLIELHIIQSFPVTALNRDDVGAPKSALFGGVPRARVSSQSWKRAIRELAKQNNSALFRGNRTLFLIEELRKALENQGFSMQDAVDWAKEIAEHIGNIDNDVKTKVALFFSPGELEIIAKRAKETFDRNENVKKVIKKLVKGLHAKDIADIAIFGRMVANDHTLTVEAAGMFSHALSTHKVQNEIDFFSAVDDLKPVDAEDAGAGHIGVLEFNSACYYRYIGLNVDMLRDENHLGHMDPNEFNAVLDAFIRAAIMAVPNARKNTMFGFTPPEYVLGLVRTGQPVSLVNAFEKPVRSGKGYVVDSIKALNEKYDLIFEKFSLGTPELKINIPDKDLDTFCSEVISHV